MKPLVKMYQTVAYALILLLVAAGAASADVVARTLSAGSASGAVGVEVVVPITVSDAGGIGGIAFTVGYDPSILEFKGMEQATSGWTIADPAGYAAADPISEGYPYYNPYKKETPYELRDYTLAANATLFYQYNDIKDASNKSIGRLMVSGASATPFTSTALFNIRFKILGGENGFKYPVQLLRSIVNNPAAGYNVDTFLPVLVGVGEAVDGLYTTTVFPVIPATLAAGGVTTSATTYSIGGKVTYNDGDSGTTDAFAVGCRVILKKETSPGSNVYTYRAETKVGADGSYIFTGRNPGKFKIAVESSDPGYNNYESATVIELTDANITNADAAMTLKPKPVPLNGNVTTGHIAGLMAKVVDPAGKVMGYFPVDPGTGNWKTPLLPALASGSYGWYLVYGSMESAKDATTFDTSTLKSISGSITGLPETGGAVTVISNAGRIAKTVSVVHVDGTEDYTIGNLVPASDYIVSAAAQGFPLAYYDGATDVNAASYVDVSSASATGIHFTFVPPGKHITGRIKENVAGVSGLTVYGFEVNSFALVSTQTNVDGNFDLNVDAGSYEVFVIKSNGRIFYFYNEDGTPTQNQSSATLRTVATADVPDTNINITECDKTLTGKVTYRNADGDPAANVLVIVFNETQKAMGITGEDGKYAIGGLCDGVGYTVEMKPLSGGYAVQTDAITGGTDTVMDFVIDTGSVLSGTVTDSSDLGVKPAGAMLYLKDKATGALVGGRIYFSGADGKYEIRDIKEGEYTLEATHPDYEGYSVDLVINSDMTQNIALSKGAYFYGTVKDAAKALPGATIIVTRLVSGATPIYAVTRSDGGYKVFGLDATKTDYMIFAQRRGYERQVKMAQQPASSPGTKVDFTLSPPTSTYKVSGKVKTDADSGAEIADAIVLVSSPGKNFFVTTKTGTDGKYEVANLVPASDYKIVVVPPGLPTQTGTFTVVNSDVTKDFTIALGKNIGGTIAGSTPIPSTTKIYVFLYKGTAYQGFKIAGVGGAFLFKGLTPGNDYKILAVAAGYTPQWYNNKATMTNADPIDVSSASKEEIAITLQAK